MEIYGTSNMDTGNTSKLTESVTGQSINGGPEESKPDKTFSCKKCSFVASRKLDLWEHSRSHIKAAKLLTCLSCSFVTEHKYHLEYHLRNHVGSKPFKCDKCSYACVTRSMLNSHLKFHSDVRQFRCADCSYATKYSHSFKLHLGKYEHKPAVAPTTSGDNEPRQHFQFNQLSGFDRISGLNLGLLPALMNFSCNQPFGGFVPNPFSIGSSSSGSPTPVSSDTKSSPSSPLTDETVESPLDLSMPRTSSASRRKSRAVKLARRLVETDSDKEGTSDQVDIPLTSPISTDSKDSAASEFGCRYCELSFSCGLLHSLHMHYHSYRDPFKCNVCGLQCTDKVSFFLHIARVEH